MSPPGTVITFYSYKGGTGRSMALANVAWILASAGKSVLLIDWDLEAPGLHRYFRPFLIDKDLTSSEGLIDFVTDFADEVVTPSARKLTEDWYFPYADITRLALSINFDDFPEGGKIDFIPAGRQGSTYSTRVNSFNWQDFYERLGGGALFDAVKEHIRSNYQYILIDSRTGVSDTAGICTVQMPDKLAVCFTYNNQSIEGAAGVASSVLKSRQSRGEAKSSNQRAGDFEVLPIPMRYDRSESDRLRVRQSYARAVFDPFIAHIFESDRRKYWLDVEVPYIAYFGYEEILAAFREEPEDPKSLLSAMVRITGYLTNSGVTRLETFIAPEVQQRMQLEFAQTPHGTAGAGLPDTKKAVTEARDLTRIAESEIARLSPSQQLSARQILTRLVSVAKSDKEISLRKLPIPLPLMELEQLDPLARKLASSAILLISGPEGREEVELANESLAQGWRRLRDWVEDDLEFLIWRQRLRDLKGIWEANDRKPDFLLESTLLWQAQKQKWLEERIVDLNRAEREFINQSTAQSSRSRTPSAGSLRAFIVRPFGIKSEIDFDKVEAELIYPALAATGYTGRTTGEILKQGNIRTDMFQRLLTADLVIADLSIHNANVFYELGIRHSLREKRTFMLRCDGDKYPFDLQTDRYFVYNKNDLKASLPLLIKALHQIQASADQDSPVFRSLPNMKPQDRSKFLAVPTDFAEEVELAGSGKHLGDLELLAAEVRGFDWESEGLRMVGRAQFRLKASEGARDTWEAVRDLDFDDLEANTLLGTIYYSLGDLRRSEQAVRRVLKRSDVAGQDRAETLSLLARNAKTNWRNEWKDLPPEKQREEALRSPYLQEALTAYADAFDEALNHLYSGLNALGLLKILIELATALPDVWAEPFDEENDAEREIEKRREQFQKLAAAVEISIDAAQKRLYRERKSDAWVDISEADLSLLTSDRPKKVASAYRKALAGAPDFAADAARTQLELYRQFGVLPQNVAAALAEFPAASPPKPPQEKRQRALLFTGHMIDKPGREKPRFPADKEDVARQAIHKAITEEQALAPVAYGIAGGASGGDVLFHEVCAELGIPTRLYLALPREEYIVESVQSAGPKWVERFNRIYQQHPETRVLSISKNLPDWLIERTGEYTIWQRNNLWMMHNALAEQEQEVTLIALWNGKAGDGPGGTGDLVEQSQRRGAKVVILDTNELFGLGLLD